MLVDGAEELPEGQIDAMAEMAIKESKTGVGELIKNAFTELVKTAGHDCSSRDSASKDLDSITFEDFSNSLKRVPIEQKLAIRFPN